MIPIPTVSIDVDIEAFKKARKAYFCGGLMQKAEWSEGLQYFSRALRSQKENPMNKRKNYYIDIPNADIAKAVNARAKELGYVVYDRHSRAWEGIDTYYLFNDGSVGHENEKFVSSIKCKRLPGYIAKLTLDEFFSEDFPQFEPPKKPYLLNGHEVTFHKNYLEYRGGAVSYIIIDELVTALEDIKVAYREDVSLQVGCAKFTYDQLEKLSVAMKKQENQS